MEEVEVVRGVVLGIAPFFKKIGYEGGRGTPRG